MNNLSQAERFSVANFMKLPFETQVSTIGSAIGYGAISAVVPTTIISNIFSKTPFPQLVSSENFFVQQLLFFIPSILFLAIVAITGALLTVLSRYFLSKKHLLACYLIALLLAIFTLFTVSTHLVLFALGVSYALSQFLWKVHLLNKDMNTYAVSLASLFTGMFILCSIFLGTAAFTILPTLLLIVGNGFFVLAIVNTCSNWVFVPHAAFRHKKKHLNRILLPTAANVLAGIAFGAIALLTDESVRFLIIGSIWLVVGLLSSVLLATNTHLYKQNLRGGFLLLIVASLVVIVVGSQQKMLCLSSSCVMLFATIFFIIYNALRHCSVQKDSDLCDVYLSAFRVFTNPLALIFGLVSSCFMLSKLPFLQTVGICLTIAAGLFSVYGILLSLGIFQKKRDPKRMDTALHTTNNTAINTAVSQDISAQVLNTSQLESAQTTTPHSTCIPLNDTHLNESESTSMFFFEQDEDLEETADEWHEKALLTAKVNGLTPRQVEIFDALSRGRNAKYIAQRLYLSEGAVKKQMFTIYKKLDVHKQQDLITLVMDGDLKELQQKAARLDSIKQQK